MASVEQFSPSTLGHMPHSDGEQCPVCDQPISNERAKQIRIRAEARDRELRQSVASELATQFAAEKAKVEASSKAAVEQANAQAEARVLAAREEGRKAAEAATTAELELAKRRALEAATQAAEAEQKAKATFEAFEALKSTHESDVSKQVQAAREALELEKANALNAERAQRFVETQKLTEKLGELQRQLEKKNASELGEGAEVDLFESLRAEFPTDRIERVAKGTPGADIIHTVIHNGRDCGIIVYDSKNRKAWNNEYVTKLRDDQRAAKADHAVLSALKFPANSHQITLRDGVIVANPSRVVAIVQIIRSHIVRTFGLRLSNLEITKKKDELYAFIMSERFLQYVEAIRIAGDKLAQLDVEETKAHNAMWTKRGKLITTLQKTVANMNFDVEQIVGTDTVEN